MQWSQSKGKKQSSFYCEDFSGYITVLDGWPKGWLQPQLGPLVVSNPLTNIRHDHHPGLVKKISVYIYIHMHMYICIYIYMCVCVCVCV